MVYESLEKSTKGWKGAYPRVATGSTADRSTPNSQQYARISESLPTIPILSAVREGDKAADLGSKWLTYQVCSLCDKSCGKNGPDHSEPQDGPNVLEKIRPVQREPSLQDDWRQQEEIEELRME